MLQFYAIDGKLDTSILEELTIQKYLKVNEYVERELLSRTFDLYNSNASY